MPRFVALPLVFLHGLIRGVFWFLLIMLVLLLLSAALEFAFEKLDDLEAFGGELFARVKSELTILGALSFCMFAVVATEMLTGYKQELVELIHFMLFIAALFYCLLVMSFLVIRSRLRRVYQTHHAWLREATPEQLQELINAKTVTIARLMEIVPAGTIDPTPTIYDTTLYTMSGVVAMAVLCNAAMRPVDLKHCETIDGDRGKIIDVQQCEKKADYS